MSIDLSIVEGKDHKDRPKLSSLYRPEWANCIIFSPRAAKLAFSRYNLDMPWSISKSLKGTTTAWGSTSESQQ